MKFKYFQITEKETLDHIGTCIISITKRNKALKYLCDVFGAYECREYSVGGVAYFSFNKTPDKKSWKKVKYGFMPKAKTK